MDALFVLALYVVPFVAIGFAAMWWARRKSTDLEDVQALGSKKRRRFLLGFWRSED